MIKLINKSSLKERGTILATTFFLVSIVSFSALYMITGMRDHQQMNQRSREIMHAYYAAEAGVNLVLHWSNYPDEYDGGGSSGQFYRAADYSFPNLTTGTLNPYILIPENKLATFTTEDGRTLAKIKEIRLLPKKNADPVDCLFKVQSTGEAPSGKDRVVLAYIDANDIVAAKLQLGAGLISLSTAAQLGNGKVHWGESWSQSDFNVLSKSQMSNLDSTSTDYDPYAKYRSEGDLIFGATWTNYDPSKNNNNNADIYDIDSNQTPGVLPNGPGDYAEAFEQFIPPGTLEWPDMLSEYDTFKSQARAHGRYYTTDASGNIYKTDVQTEDNKIVFDEEFGTENRDSEPYDLVFIDTIDQQAPLADGSNLSTVSNSGNNVGMKGVFYICANYSQGGSGNPDDLDSAEKPFIETDGTTAYTQTSLSKVYLDGVMYTAGTMQFQGNPVVYGSLIAEKGYLSGGTPDIYYNHKLKDGIDYSPGNVGSVFTIVLQDNF